MGFLKTTPWRTGLAIAMVAGTAAGSLTILALQNDSPGPQSSPPQQQFKSQPSADANNWKADLAAPKARLAYTDNAGVYLLPIGGTPVRLENLVDISGTRPHSYWVTELEWSLGGRYLAWRQQIFDDPGYEELMPTTDLNKLTIIDTNTGQRHTWLDEKDPGQTGLSERTTFFRDTYVTWWEGKLYLARAGQVSIRIVPVPLPDTVHLVGAMADGLLMRGDTGPDASQFWLVTLDGSVRKLGKLAGTYEVSAVAVDPTSNRIGVIAKEPGTPHTAADHVLLTREFTHDPREIKKPPTPSEHPWVSTALGFDPDGRLYVGVTQDQQTCGGAEVRQQLARQQGDQAVIVPLPEQLGPCLLELIGGPNQLVLAASSHRLSVVNGSSVVFEFELDEVNQNWRWAPSATPNNTPGHTASQTPPTRVDWRNTTYTTNCANESSSPLTVTTRDGTGNAPGPKGGSASYKIVVVAVTTGDMTNDNRPETAALLACSPPNTNFVVWEIQVLAERGDLLATLVVEPLRGALYPAVDYIADEFWIRENRLVVGVNHYGPNDSHASGGSIHQTLSWRMNGKHLVPVPAPTTR